MKYWILTTEFPPFHGGGISTYCLHTASMLSGEGYTVTVFIADETVGAAKTQTGQNFRIVRFRPSACAAPEEMGHAARLSYAFSDCVRQFIAAEGRPDCIEAQDYLGIAYYLTQFKHSGYSWIEKTPIIITLHSPAFLYLQFNRAPVYRLPDYWTGEMEKQAIAAADLLISPSQYLASELTQRLPISEKSIRVIPNPYAAKTQPDSGYQKNRILYYGKLSAQKGSFVLLEHFRQLWDDGFKHPLHMVGGTDIVYHPEQRTMGSLVKDQYGKYIQSGLLFLHPKIQPDAIPASLREAHVVIVPSLIDNMPYVVAEAMSLAKVVLVSAQGGQSEMVVDGVSGFVFDHEKENDFREKLLHILSLPEQDINTIGQKAVLRVQEMMGYAQVSSLKMQLIDNLVTDAWPGKRFPFLYQEPIKPMPPIDSVPGKLSVIIPCFNMGRFIARAVSSVINNGWPDTEVIIIDDGSTEPGLTMLLTALADRYHNLKIMRRANRGLAFTRNEGAAIATGEFLAFLDADDEVVPGYYEKAIHTMRRKENVFFVGCWVRYTGESDQTWVTSTPQPPLILVHNSINSSSLVYRRNAFLSGGMNDRNTDYGWEDYESVVNMLSNGYNGIVLPEILFRYQVRQDSMFRKLTTAKQLYSYAQISQKHRGYFNQFAIDIVNLLNANGPGYLFDNFSIETGFRPGISFTGKISKRVRQYVRRKPILKKVALNLLNRLKR